MFRGLLLALLWMAAIGRVAWADDPLANARALIAESDYVAARPLLATALTTGGRGPEETAEIYRLSGIVDAALGDAKSATDAFTKLLALDPKATLPAGTSPKIKRPFDAAVRYWKSRAPLEAKIETLSTPPVVTLVVVSDPLKLVARAEVVFAIDGGPERRLAQPASERTQIALPAGRRIDLQLHAIDANGNRLVEIGSKQVPIVIVSDAPLPAAPPPVIAAPSDTLPTAPRAFAPAGRRPIYLRWWPYAAVAGVAAAGTGYFALAFRSDKNELQAMNNDPANHSFDESRAVEDSARKNLKLTTIGLGVTGAFAVAAGVMYLLTPRDEIEPRVTAVPLPGGAALVFGGRL